MSNRVPVRLRQISVTLPAASFFTIGIDERAMLLLLSSAAAALSVSICMAVGQAASVVPARFVNTWYLP